MFKPINLPKPMIRAIRYTDRRTELLTLNENTALFAEAFKKGIATFLYYQPLPPLPRAPNVYKYLLFLFTTS